MTQTFEILPEPTRLDLAAGASAALTFTLTNTKAEAMDVQISVDVGDVPLGWITLEGTSPRPVAAKGVETIVVRVAPPAGAPAQAVSVKLIAASTTNPELDWAASPEVRVQVGEGKSDTKKWILLAIAVLVILGGAAAGAWALSRKGGPLAACEAVEDCREGLACVTSGPGEGSAKLCKVPDAAGCNSDAQCVSNFCVPQAKVCAPKIAAAGEACDALPCAEGLECFAQGGAKTCVAALGARCDADGECKSGFCHADQGCARPPVHTTCSPPEDPCYPSQSCKSLGGTPPTRVCFWVDGEACAQDNECAGGWCKSGKCQTFDGRCRRGQDCRPGQVCHEELCLLPNGRSCDDNLDCVSANCEAGQCNTRAQAINRCRRNGRAVACPKGQRCVPSTGQCRSIAASAMGRVFDAKVIENAARMDAFEANQRVKKAARPKRVVPPGGL